MPGPRTQLEYLLVSQILSFCRQWEIDTELVTIQKLYSTCVELAQILDGSLPLGLKRDSDISQIVDEYETHRRVFEATCIAQLKINLKQQYCLCMCSIYQLLFHNPEEHELIEEHCITWITAYTSITTITLTCISSIASITLITSIT